MMFCTLLSNSNNNNNNITLLCTHTYTHTVKHVHLFITEPVAQLVLACATQMAVIDYCPVQLLDPSSIIAHLIIYVPLLCDSPKQTLSHQYEREVRPNKLTKTETHPVRQVVSSLHNQAWHLLTGGR